MGLLPWVVCNQCQRIRLDKEHVCRDCGCPDYSEVQGIEEADERE